MKNEQAMNLVIVTSMLRPLSGRSVFTVSERISQTTKTIESIKAKIPKCYIVLVEGSFINKEEEELFKTLSNHLYITDVSFHDKSHGEALLIYNYLTSDHFSNVISSCSTITKLSGRYYLNEGFDDLHSFSLYSPYSRFFQEFCILCVEKSHAGLKAFNTTFYKLHMSHLQRFIEGLRRFITKRYAVDIEHSFDSCNIVPGRYHNLQKIHVSGFISGDGTFVEM